ncbi:DNA binding HTH domain, Fis-type [uncultured Caudovirales phage]|uniref:DNA binding HTH domain, Fis-type n=1 Tax=uncultured Caudovirales phage TaxID=2100421 RepID=A0A6J5L9E8_9CAUD|nr:DNA binding HTH domain, Fis-type [uncultured Caudovirales phage]
MKQIVSVTFVSGQGIAPGELRLEREEIKAVLRRYRGSMSGIARGLGIDPVNVSQWLKGRCISARVAEACERTALHLLNLEVAESHRSKSTQKEAA